MQTLIDREIEPVTDEQHDAAELLTELARARHEQLEAARAGRVLESARHAARARALRDRVESRA